MRQIKNMTDLDAAFMAGEIDAETYSAIGQANIDKWRQDDYGWLAAAVVLACTGLIMLAHVLNIR